MNHHHHPNLARVAEWPSTLDNLDGKTPALKTVPERIEQGKREILADIAAGRVPASVSTFSELHDHVDANEYGGLCDEATWADVENDTPEYEALADVANRVQDALNAWLMNGRPMKAPPADGQFYDSPDFPPGRRVDVDDLEPGDLILVPVWGTPRRWVLRRVESVSRVGSDHSRIRVTFPRWTPAPGPSENFRTFAPISTVWKAEP